MELELYTLDSLFRRVDVIDVWKSLIWTERFGETGDFQLDIVSTVKSRSTFTVGTILAMNHSFRVMIVNSVEDDDSSDGERLLTVKGTSLEVIMQDRVAMGSLTDLTTSPNWMITDAPTAVMRKIFHDICVTGILSAQDVIPFIVEGTFMSASTIAEPIDPITVTITPATVYDAIKQIADVWNIGFRMLRHYDTSQIYWDVYTGNDLTSGQTLRPAVVFDPQLDNLQNTKELVSIVGAKNCAYVFSPAGFQMVYPVGVDPEVEGFDRHVLVVDASDVTTDTYTTPEAVEAALILAGNNALAQAQKYQAFDGEIPQSSSYKYGVDYNLGDLVEQRNTDGVANNMRVTEQIFVSDADGVRSYPTLTLNTFITTGSWLSWLPTKYWADMGLTDYWADQP
jgi:hypothetical protein